MHRKNGTRIDGAGTIVRKLAAWSSTHEPKAAKNRAFAAFLASISRTRKNHKCLHKGRVVAYSEITPHRNVAALRAARGAASHVAPQPCFPVNSLLSCPPSFHATSTPANLAFQLSQPDILNLSSEIQRKGRRERPFSFLRSVHGSRMRLHPARRKKCRCRYRPLHRPTRPAHSEARCPGSRPSVITARPRTDQRRPPADHKRPQPK